MGVSQMSFKLETIGRMVSLPFLSMTYFIYLYSTKLGYLYRKLFMDFLLSLIVFNTLKVGVNIYFRTEENGTYKIWDEFIYVLTATSLLMTNVLCFDFWLSTRNLMLRNGKRADKTTYIKCSIYVLSGSLFDVTTRSIYLASSTESMRMSDHRLDGLPRTVVILLLISITFRILVILSNFWMLTHATLMMLREIQLIKNLSGSNVLRSKDDYKKKLIMCVKLFTVAIVSLLFAPLLRDLVNDFICDSQILYDCLILGNSLQGIFIFILFTLKKKNLLVFKKWVFNIFCHKNTDTEFNSSENQVIKKTAESIPT